MSVKRLLGQLKKIKNIRDHVTSLARAHLLSILSRKKRFSAEDLLQYHDLLLFLAAFPDNKKMERTAQRELRRVTAIATSKIKKDRDFLKGSGIAGCWHTDSFSLDLFKIMTKRLGRKIDIHFEEDESVSEAFDDFLQECIFSGESDAVFYEGASTKDLLKMLAQGAKRTPLQWFISAVEQLSIPSKQQDRLIASLDMWADWQTSQAGWSRTFLRFPARKNTQKLLDVCRGTLVVRGRETDPVIYTTPQHVRLHRRDHGIEIALFELNTERRLPFETYIGYVAARNRIPISYGGAWILGHRAELGGNIFEEFRGGDSRTLFKELIEAYRSTYNLKTITIQPAQFGGDNDEALQSGAFWFYYHLGFRPDDKQLCKLAIREVEKRKKNRSYKSSLRILKKLSATQLVLPFDAKTTRRDIKLTSQKIGFAIAKQIATRFRGDRMRALQHVDTLWRAMEPRHKSKLPPAALILLLFPDLHRWTSNQKSALYQALLSKIAGSENNFVIEFQRWMDIIPKSSLKTLYMES